MTLHGSYLTLNCWWHHMNQHLHPHKPHYHLHWQQTILPRHHPGSLQRNNIPILGDRFDLSEITSAPPTEARGLEGATGRIFFVISHCCNGCKFSKQEELRGRYSIQGEPLHPQRYFSDPITSMSHFVALVTCFFVIGNMGTVVSFN